MKDHWLSTGKAARLCSVNPDTVLKWIKKGRLAATRTAGGHYRIEEHDIAAFIPPSLVEIPSTQASEGRPLRCWEYLSRPGGIRDECKNCVVYQIRAAWCFQVASLECDIGRLKSSCNAPCEDCVYYRRATGQATNVLVITSDTKLVDSLGQVEHENIALRFARSAYDASGIAWSFRPAFAVVDQELRGGSSGPDLLDSLVGDPRLPGLRIILGVPKGKAPRFGDLAEKGVVSVIEKPFGTDRIVEVIQNFPVELLLKTGAGTCPP